MIARVHDHRTIGEAIKPLLHLPEITPQDEMLFIAMQEKHFLKVKTGEPIELFEKRRDKIIQEICKKHLHYLQFLKFQ